MTRTVSPSPEQLSELKPCRACGAPCRVETFGGGIHVTPTDLWLCSKHSFFGGDCPSDVSYFNASLSQAEPLVPNAEIPHPRLIKRHCGGWLAVSPSGCSLKIGVTGPTSEAAEANYRESYIAWARNLAMGAQSERAGA
jgi:hypothetical protein